MFLLIISTNLVYAESCVKIRDGKEGYDCMKFSKKARESATKYGLKLGAKYSITRMQLIKHGWSVDQNWLKENSFSSLYKNELVCGSGFDAICSTVFIKNRTNLFLTLGGTNDEIRLISVVTQSSRLGN